MKYSHLSEEENQRLEILNQYDILDTLPESDFDDITRIAAEICNTPIALVSLVDAERQWFKSHLGLDTHETKREYSFCAHAILEPDKVMVVPDSSQDQRFATNPLATGDPYVVFYAGAPLTTPTGHALGTLCVIDSIPRNLNPDQISALKALANQVVSQLELRKKIREMEAMSSQLEKANQALNRFAYSCSHDMKAPMSNIGALATLLKEKHGSQLDKAGHQCVDYIQGSAEKMNHLIDDILSYSKVPDLILQGKKQVSLEQCFLDICQMLMVPEDMTIDYPEGLPVIEINPTVLAQVMQNLISNAIKYNDKAQGRINISFSETPMYWKFTVEDNGPGISEEEQKKIFDAFQTLGHKDRNGKTGSGIGLTTVKLLVEESGGEVSLVSRQREGCCFTFTLKK